MHILEILQPTAGFSQIDKRLNPVIGMSYKKNPKHIDSGTYALVSKDDDPHMVNRVSRGDEETRRDAYWVFVKYIVKHKLWENPYFPRLYSQHTTVYSDKQGKKTSVFSDKQKMKSAKIEKLNNLNELRTQEGIFLYKKIFGEDVNNFDKDKIADRIEKEVESLSFVGDSSKYDVNYIKAAKILHNIASKEKFILDIWYSNIMFRRNNYGVQLVFTDPFSSRLD